jgi:hypothetical protein
MTPYIRYIKDINEKILIEVSEGEDFNHKPIYGVTLIRKTTNNTFKANTDLTQYNKLFSDLKEANKYVSEIEITLKEVI